MQEEEKSKLTRRLQELTKEMECPLCHHKEFFFLSDYVINSLSGDYESGPLIAAPTLPCVAIVCKHCGFVSQHSITTFLKEAEDER